MRVALAEAVRDLGLERMQELRVAEALGEPPVLEPALVPSPIQDTTGVDGDLPSAVGSGRATPPVDGDDQAERGADETVG